MRLLRRKLVEPTLGWLLLPPFCAVLSWLSCLLLAQYQIGFFPLTSQFLQSPLASLIVVGIGIPLLVLALGVDVLLLMATIAQSAPILLALSLSWGWAGYLLTRIWAALHRRQRWLLLSLCLGSSGLGYLLARYWRGG